MATSNKPKDDVDAMFDQEDKDNLAAQSDDFDDLLDDVEEDDSEGWVPKEKGEGISGLVIKVGETKSDFAADGQDPLVPVVTIQTADGTKWRVIGYSSVLKREIQDADPKVGDRMAVKFFGEKTLKTGKFAGRPYKHFGVAIRRAPAAVVS
jgi:hypothetical protein